MSLTTRLRGPRKIPCKHADRERPYYLCDDIITVTAGSLPQTFSVHKGLITHYSKYFRGVFRNQCKENAQNKVHLSEDSPKTVEQALYWMYTDRFQASSSTSYEDLVKLYLFADKRGIPELLNRTLDAIVVKIGQSGVPLPIALVDAIYDNTIETSPIRQFLADYFANTLSTVDEQYFHTPHADFSHEVLWAVRMKESTPEWPTEREARWEKMVDMFCERYHDHLDDDEER